ncbi:BREX-1 system adenine-specific DNA-methyltransferase PglX [Selenomonas noxia]|uniref:BREX-1 system adenine-specific DNA-methyltransferase PglX n=1 Tax=Selenomonas noxia TaxID=135083 RepID=UPI0032C15B1A
MNKNAIKKYAVRARCELIDRVSKKAMRYGIAPEIPADPEADSVDGRLLSDTEKKQRAALIEKVAVHGYEQTMEEAAYTWFNRFAALRFMEVNGYLPSHVRVFTNDAGEFRPQILAEAIHLDLPGLDKEKVYALKEANDEEALFRYLIIVQCNALNEILPGMFQRLEDFTELLLPDNLLREDSVIDRLVKQGDAGSIPEEDWHDQVQIIGWLYQYYNTEPKDKVFADLKKNIKVTKEKIPAATQLFTPDWIVRYMVENSLGRLWLEGHPNEILQGEWKYYLPEAEQEEAVQKQLAEMRKGYANIKPEDIRCIDPCMGSGHILCYMFDVLVRIYEDYGYTAREAAASILQNNLYGLDIDDRAAQLAYFAVMMKARQYDRRFFSRGIQPNVMAIQESNGLKTWTETAGDSLAFGQLTFEDDFIRMADALIETFHDAKEYGSILTVQPERYDALVDFIEKTRQEAGNLLFRAWIDEVEQRILPLTQQAKWLSAKYDIVVTNPPYMKEDSLPVKLHDAILNTWEFAKYDLYAAFICRCYSMVKENGIIAMITMHNFMFSPSFLAFRDIYWKYDWLSMVHLGARAFSDISGEVVQTTSYCIRKSYVNQKCQIVDVTEEKDSYRKEKHFLLKKNLSYLFDLKSTSKIPWKAFGYGLSAKVLEYYTANLTLESHCVAKAGVVTGNDDFFCKLWHEINFSDITLKPRPKQFYKYVPFSRGGTFVKWYGNTHHVLRVKDMWNNELTNQSVRRGDVDYYYQRGIGWSQMGGGKNKAYSLIENSVCKTTTPMLYPDEKSLHFILGYLNSPIPIKILKSLNPTLSLLISDILHLPYIGVYNELEIVEEKVERCIDIARENDKVYETSWDFESHPLIPMAYERREQLSYGIYSAERKKSVTLLADRYTYWEQDCNDRFSTLKKNEEELNRIFIDIYGLTNELTPEVEDKDVTVRRADLPRDIRSLISYAVGCMFGRYSLDTPGLAYAGGVWDDSKYTTFLPDEDAVIPICDDEYFDDDIVGRFVAFITAAFGEETLEENLQFIADALGGRGSSREIIRSYFLTGFYADHIKTYQKRPIYWLFDSGKKNGFKCLVYMHRYGADTLARIRMDYVHEQQSRYRTAIDSLEQARDNAATAGDRVKAGKKLASVEAKAKELHEYEEKIHHLADQMIAIDLDDGVKHNYAIFQDVLAKIK